MPFEKPTPFRIVRLRLEELGFRGISQLGNHAKFIKMQHDDTRTAILPHFNELTVSVLKSIARQAAVDEDLLCGG